MNPPDLTYVWDWARLFVALGGFGIGVASLSLLLRKMPNIPPLVEASRTTLILGLVLMLGSSITARLRYFQEPPTPQLVMACFGTVVLIVWVFRERRALRDGP